MFNIADGRIYMNDDAENMIVEVPFLKINEKQIIINHTFLDESQRGRGIAARLRLEE